MGDDNKNMQISNKNQAQKAKTKQVKNRDAYALNINTVMQISVTKKLPL